LGALLLLVGAVGAFTDEERIHQLLVLIAAATVLGSYATR
jgi:hypothetical protein